MQHTCPLSGTQFKITPEDEQFYEKMNVPIPELCPTERQRQRIIYRNFRSLYRRKCDVTGKEIISMYHADQPFPVYQNDYWWGDQWSPFDYGAAFDFAKDFFPQYKEKIANRVPRTPIFNVQCENALYSNFSWKSRNCYLVFGCVRDEDCLYGHIVWDCRDCVDNLYIFRCEWCSNCLDCVDCYNTHFSTECSHCTDSYFLHDCRSCRNCFGCVNLRNKEYHFFNQKYSKTEYEEKLKAFFPLTHQTIKQGIEWLENTKKTKAVFPPYFGVQNEDVSGNHLYECKNCQQSFDAKRGEDSKYLFTSYEQIHSHDMSFTGDQTNFCYNCLTLGNCNDCIGCHGCNGCNNMDYCEFCYQSHDCFGCMGLRNAQYCVLNKQYTKEEYTALREKLVEHMLASKEWGLFFPAVDSPFAYNEAIVNEYLPLSREVVEQRGLRWLEAVPQLETYDGTPFAVPESIAEVQDDILEKILVCETTGKKYKVTKAELAFYRRMGLPVPKVCPDERHTQRMNMRNLRTLYDRTCPQCQVAFQSTFSPDSPEKILCESCYLQRIE